MNFDHPMHPSIWFHGHYRSKICTKLYRTLPQILPNFLPNYTDFSYLVGYIHYQLVS